MMTKQYKFPVEGTVLDWEGFKGSNSNPIRPKGLREMVEAISDDFYSYVVDTYDMENGTVIVDITATDAGHQYITSNLPKGKGVRRYKGDPQIKVSTSVKRVTKMRG